MLVRHVEVAKAFIPNPNNLPEVNHDDLDKENNCVENLEWITSKGNVQHARAKGVWKHVISSAMAKLTENDVRQIRDMYSQGKMSYEEIGKLFHIRGATVHRVVKFQTYKWVK